jgi:putative solute:sodium symporter small subunit
MNNLDPRQIYWRKNKALIRNLLIIWAIVSLLLSILLVQPLNRFHLGQVPFGFWMAQQGSIYVFVVLIFVYATQMDKLDRKYNNGSGNGNGNNKPPH